MAVPFLDTRAQYGQVARELESAILEVARSGSYILGERVAELERRLAAYVDVPFAVGCASGTDALILALRAIGAGPGDEVITTPYSFFSTASAIVLVGARPVFADIDPATFNIDPAAVEKNLNARTRAIIPVHLFGQPAEMEPIVELARDWGVRVIEDACQAIGAEYKGKRVCSLGDIGCVSFYPTKNLAGMGDGGMLFTSDRGIAEKLRALRVHGARRKYHHEMLGYNSRLDEIQAAVLLVKQRLLEEWTEARRVNARIYNEMFIAHEVVTPHELPYVRHVYNQYVVRLPKRDELVEYLARRNIGSAVYYPVPLHLQECFSPLGYSAGDFPEAERAARESIALPVYPGLAQAQVQEAARAVISFVS